VTPSEDVRHHLRARRLDGGDAVQLTNGEGLPPAAIRTRGKHDIELAISSVTDRAQPADHLRARRRPITARLAKKRPVEVAS
jgi:hypothetical protein